MGLFKIYGIIILKLKIKKIHRYFDFLVPKTKKSVVKT